MLATNEFAFKEWAVVCASLNAGRQSLILRKGGIHERGGRFEIEHGEFWLYPSRFHQNADELRPEAASLLEQVQKPTVGTVAIQIYATVEEALRIDDRETLARIAGIQILSDDTLATRFEYREPGLFVLLVRIYRMPTPILIDESPAFAGCRTWVDLGQPLPLNDLPPVLDDANHAVRMAELRACLHPHG